MTSGARAAGRSDAPEPTERTMRARGRRTRLRLLDAGAQVFTAKGYHATRVDDIVNVAATSHGTFYLYFANKEDLFAALAGEVAAEMQSVAETLGPLRPGPDGRAEIRNWVTRLADIYDRYGPVIRVWSEVEIAADDNDPARLGVNLLTRFTGVLRDRIAAVAPPGLDAEVASLALVAMVERLHYYSVAGQAEVERDVMLDTLAWVIYSSLFGTE